MKLSALYKVVFLFLIILPVSFSAISQHQQSRVLVRVIRDNHYKPRPVDDLFSEILTDKFLDRLDPDRLYFTAADIRELSSFRKLLDDELNGGTPQFINRITPVYQRRLRQSDSIITDITSRPFDFTKDDFFSEAEDTTWPAGEKEKKTKWYQTLKYETLHALADLASVQLSKTGNISSREILEREADVRLKIKARYIRQINGILQAAGGFGDHVFSLYLDAIASCFDPHTNYFPETEKQNFESSLSKDGYSFGFVLGENEDEEPMILHLEPGGPAWKTGELNQGDVPIQIKWKDKEAVDLVGADADEVSALLDASNMELLELTVKKTNGQIKTVQLQKEKMEAGDEDVVKSFLLSGDTRIGYISLPGFYTEWENEGGSSCANDVAKEILKLRKENINGIILDLRFNGGGSVSEALDLAGIFIDEGPLCMYREKEGKVNTWKDPNRGSIYDGPLLILVNGQSASASELVAATLQDYNRAIIAGSATFGKATGQHIVPITSGTTTVIKEQGFVKVTNRKLYRLTGKSVQKTGVIPDIRVPDLFDELTYSEKDLPEALAADTVTKNAYYKPLTPLPVAALIAKSEERIRGDDYFQQLLELKKKIKDELSLSGPVSLKWEETEKKLKENALHGIRKFGEEMKSVTSYRAENHQYDKSRIGTDEFFSLINSSWIRRLESDHVLEECFRIVADLFSIYNQKK